MRTFAKTFLIFLTSILLSALHGFSQTSSLPLFQVEQLSYQGAFRLPATDFGISDMNFAEGPFAYNPDNHSIFIVGHTYEQAIAEFAIPVLVRSESISDLNMSPAPMQTFTQFLNSTPDGNPQILDRIGGIHYWKDGAASRLIVNAYEYYDAAATNTLTTLVVDDATNLATSTVDGYFDYQGIAGHTAGWISPIPLDWQSDLGGTLITGNSSGIPIIGRASVGPSAFVFSPEDIAMDSIPTSKLMDFSLANPLNSDLYNTTLTNDIWTHISRATYGFIVPDTRTYFTLGYSGGHDSGICYKCTQNNGYECPGYCPPDTADYDQYYWLWDMNDLVEVKNGLRLPHEITPYAYGKFPTVFQHDFQQISGASFDPLSNTLYLSIERADDEQGIYSNPPIIAAYAICNAENAPDGLSAIVDPSGVTLSWNAVRGAEGCKIDAQRSSPPGPIVNKILEGFELDQFSIPASFLPSGETWDWRLRCACSIDPFIPTPFSSMESFTSP